MKRTILIVPDKVKGKDDAHLRCRVRWTGNNVVAFLVGYKVILSKWSQDAQRCKANTMHGEYSAQKVNAAIDKMIQNIHATFDYFEGLDTIPTKESFKKYYEDHFTAKSAKLKDEEEKRKMTFVDIIDSYMKEMGKSRNWSEDCYNKFNALLDHIADYNNVAFDEIDAKYLDGYVQFCIKNKMRNTTTLKQVDYIRCVLKYADERAMITDTSWKGWHPRLKVAQKKVIFLDRDEVMQVLHADISKQHLCNVRDVFCFCCFTGLRYSDVKALKKSDIREDRISITSHKDHESLEINLNKYAKTILERYAHNGSPMALPVVSNPTYNEHIKTVMEMCKINKLVSQTYYIGTQRFDETLPKYMLMTTHAARRTFICNALALGISVNTVMSFTGHSDYSAMKPYIDVADSAKKAAMDKFNEI